MVFYRLANRGSQGITVSKVKLQTNSRAGIWDLQASNSGYSILLQQFLLTKQLSKNNKNIKQISNNVSVLSLFAFWSLGFFPAWWMWMFNVFHF